MTAPDTRDSVPFMQRCYTCGRESPHGPLLHYPDCQVGSSALPQQAGGEDAKVQRFTVVGDIAYPIHEDDEGDYVLYDDYAALQAEVARLREEQGEWQRVKIDLMARVVTAEAALREAQANDRRYRWLRDRLDGVDFAYGEPARTVLTFAWPDGVRVGANLDKNIDAAIGGTGDA